VTRYIKIPWGLRSRWVVNPDQSFGGWLRLYYIKTTMIHTGAVCETLVCLTYLTWLTTREDFVETLIFLHVVRTLHFVTDDILTAIGLPPGGSSTVHIYTQTIHRTTQSTQTIHRTTQLDVRISYEHSNVLSLPDVITYTFIRNNKQLPEHLSNRTDDLQ
jgi:hypothetical protein